MKLVQRTIDIDADPGEVYEHFIDATLFIR